MQLFDLKEMKRRLAEIDAERDPLVHLIKAAETYTAMASHRSVSEGDSSSPRKSGRASPGGKTVLGITEDMALELIAQKNAPATTRDVINLMKERGGPLPNKNVVNVISARLSNSQKLIGRRGSGWWPVGRPWPDQEPDMLRGSHETDSGSQNENEALNGSAAGASDANQRAAPLVSRDQQALTP